MEALNKRTRIDHSWLLDWFLKLNYYNTEKTTYGCSTYVKHELQDIKLATLLLLVS